MTPAGNLERHYAAIESSLDLLDEPNLGGLVVPNGNGARPYHRWFHLKEGYSCDLLPSVLERLNFSALDRVRIIDPFVGSGTTLISAHEWAMTHADTQVEAIGVEANPFLQFLVETKVASLKAEHRAVDVGELHAAEPDPIPALATFRDPRFFAPAVLDDLLRLRAAIEASEAGLVKEMQRLALAATVEPASRLRRDGRTLRHWPSKVPVDPRVEYERRLKMMLADHQGVLGPSPATLAVHLGDGRRFRQLTGSSSVDLVIFSPPYPNNIDYTEVYKLEAWFLGHYRSADDFRTQRRRTLRSHPSVRFDDDTGLADEELENEVGRIVNPILDAIPPDRYRHERRRTIRGYAADLASTLREAREATAPGGAIVVVVGNSLHGHGDQAVLVAADLVIAEVARAVGLRERQVLVARRPVRRSMSEPRLRESVLILRP